MSDKKDRGYDPCLLRAVGNILAGNDKFQDDCIQGGYTSSASFEDRAIAVAVSVRSKLRKLQKKEEEND